MKIDRTVIAEFLAGLASLRVKRDQARIDGGDIDAQSSAGITPSRGAPVRIVAITGVFIDLSIVCPAFSARNGINGVNSSERSPNVKRAVYVNRSSFKRRRLAFLRLVGVAGAERPGDF